MFFKGWPDPPNLTNNGSRKKHPKKARHQHKANPHRRWCKRNPPGSPGRLAWEQKKELDARFKQLVSTPE